MREKEAHEDDDDDGGDERPNPNVAPDVGQKKKTRGKVARLTRQNPSLVVQFASGSKEKEPSRAREKKGRR
jgi:hypothetical protein